MAMKSVSANNFELIEDKQKKQRLIKPYQPIFKNHIYLSHPENKTFIQHEPQIFNSLKSVSANSVENNEFKEKNQTVTMLNIPVASNITDSCTQTSKTILQLAKLEADSLTPDSLTQSPRNPELLSEDNNFNMKHLDMSSMYPEISSNCYTMEGSVCEHSTPIAFERKNNLKQYLDGYKASASVPSEEEIYAYPKTSLTETFLNKKRYDDKSATCNCRSTFLQQTSPLRNLAIKSPKFNEDHFKSQSYIEQCSSKFSKNYNYYKKLPNQISRFTVKGVKEQQYVDSTQSSLKCYWEPAKSKNISKTHESQKQIFAKYGDFTTPHRSSRNSSCAKGNDSPVSSTFMSPTISSEQKNQAHIVKGLKHLISPTRRGRSLSPSQDHQKPNTEGIKMKKIPYIDQSQSNLTINQHKSSKQIFIRKNISHRGGSPQSLFTPLEMRPKFEEDLLKIDLESLHVKLSEGAVCESIQPSRSSSVMSNENALMSAISRIRDPDWSEALKGLAEIIELCRIIDRDIIFPHMTAVNQRLLELLRSSRSHVCRTASQAAGHLFELMKDIRRPEFDDIVENLLCKTADANKFIRKDANLSLDCMVTHIPIQHAVRSLCLKGPSHKNALVRTATIRLIICALVIAGPCAILTSSNHEYTRKRIILHMAKFLSDKNLETRKYGERLYKILCKEVAFESCLKKYMDKEDIIAMKKSLTCKHQKR